MSRTTAILLALLLATVAVVPAEASDSLHVTRSVFTAEKNKQKHPATLVHTITIIRDVPSSRVCIVYENTSKKSQGWAVVNILVQRADGTEEELRLSNQVADNTFTRCTRAGEIADLAPDDVLLFDWETENMLRLRRDGDTIDRAIFNSVVVADGFPLYVEQVGVLPGEEEKGKKGGWQHSENFNFQAMKNKEKHQPTATRTIILQEDTMAPNVCASYRNSFNKGGKGTVKATVTIYRGEEVLETFSFKNKVKKNVANECKVGIDLETGDLANFFFEFNNLPRLAKKSKKTDYVEITGSFAYNGEAQFVTTEDASPDPGNPTDPNPNTPPPSGGFSAADLSAAAKILYGPRPAQLWRFKNNQPTIWTVIGPGTQLGDGPGGINPGTVGYGNTIAAALADYEKKRGKFSAAKKALSSADVTALTWFRNINTSQGPTSVRMGRSGGWTGEFYRPGKGVNHQTFGSFVAAINYFKANGL